MENRNKYLTTTELAKMLGITRAAVQKKIKAKEIQATRIGRGYLIDKTSLPKRIKERLEKEKQKTVEEITKKVEAPKVGLGFEKELWAAADKMRGNVDVSEYKHIVLGLLFLKYVSDSFFNRREELERKTADPKDKEYYMKDEKTREVVVNDKDQYQREGVFYIPKKARWDYLRAHAMHDDIAKYLDDAMDAIEKENPKQLEGVLPKIYVRVALEPYVLGELVNIFSKLQFNHDIDKERDILGRVYEYFLGQFASAEGKRGGEFYTPRSLVKLLVEVLEPFENARVLDPACGSGGMFVQSSEFLRLHKKDPSKISIFGQELNTTTLRLCKMNLAIRGIPGKIEVGNTYYDDKFPDLRADFVLANPPFNADWDPGRINDKDPRVKYGMAPKSSANFMWIQHFIHHLAPNGMAGFVMANGALAGSGREAKIREKIIKDDLIDVIIACPPKLFYNVALPVSLWFATKNKKDGRFRDRRGEVLFIDAREEYESESRRHNIFTDKNIDKIAGIVRTWRGEKGAGKYNDIPGFCKSATLEEIEKSGWVLTPGRYVGIPEEEDDGVPFEEKMNKLASELNEYFKEGEKLEKKILENLRKLDV